jgi:polyhydroxyalkanoate synthesis regulator protein
MAPSPQPVVIKLYENLRLYRPDMGVSDIGVPDIGVPDMRVPDMGVYVTLDDLAAMIEDDEDFAVCEARTGEDITPSILKLIIRKRELQ